MAYTGPVVTWAMIFMLVILKIPIVYLCAVIWWAIKAEPEARDVVGPRAGRRSRAWRPDLESLRRACAGVLRAGQLRRPGPPRAPARAYVRR